MEIKRTPKARVVSALRKLWLWSNERNAAIKRDKYTCVKCGSKQCKVAGQEFKVQVHHKKGIANWDKVYKVVMEEILCDPEHLETLCKPCHDKETFK